VSAGYAQEMLIMFMSRSTSLAASGPRRHSRAMDLAPSQPIRRVPVAVEPSAKVAVMEEGDERAMDWSFLPYWEGVGGYTIK
jgi:hypothetical protein